MTGAGEAPLAGRYRLVTRIASGATASVWRGVDTVLDRPVAVKVLHPHLRDDVELATRFAAEARAAARLGHPSIVAVYDTVTDPGALVMELVEGGDLRERIATGPLDVGELVALLWQVSDGLDHAHRAGLIHRDVKPANILITRTGRVKLGDFGIATARPGDLTATGVVLGTAKYVAPEQVRGAAIDARTDVYALCVVGYEAATGLAPFIREGELATALARLEEAPVPPRRHRPELAPSLERVILTGLSVDPEGRWASAAALRDSLTAVADELGIDPTAAVVTPTTGGTDPCTTPASDPTDPGATPATDPTDAMDPTTAALDRERVGPAVSDARRPRRRARRWLRGVLAATGFAAVAVLGWVLVSEDDLFGALRDLMDDVGGEGAALPVVTDVRSFDPEGSGPPGEHDELLPALVDRDPETAWRTEGYDQADLGAKRGVGVILDLAERSRVRSLAIATADQGWAVEVYVTETEGAVFEELSGGPVDAWGAPVLVAAGLGGDTTLSVDDEATALLVWFVELGDQGPPHRLTVSEIEVR